ncbi:Hypothetical protein PHPALM_9076 [Phytophthora palmivora]|uniref:DUF6818 domain-containing protein n=1 Tax=Phytophthora palmivora TaxID=4796 RepID=A0A2P4Y879_9STRA|nr:Hypothetical protein PHPALM_9076 [Phytophthora palmivora]
MACITNAEAKVHAVKLLQQAWSPVNAITLEKQLELATEDYDTAASYDEELQSLRKQEKTIRSQLDPTNSSSDAVPSSMFGGLDVKADASQGSEYASPKDQISEPVTSGSLFGRLQMSNGPSATLESSTEHSTSEPDIEVEDRALKSGVAEVDVPLVCRGADLTREALLERDLRGKRGLSGWPLSTVSSVKVEVVPPTSSDMKDSFCGNLEAPDHSSSLVAPSASGSLFGGLRLSGSFQVSTSSVSSPEKMDEEDKEDKLALSDDAVATSDDVNTSASTPADSGSMLNGLQLSFSGVGAQAESAADSTETPADMFGGLQLSSSAITETTYAQVEPTSTEASTDVFGGLQMSNSTFGSAQPEPALTTAPTDMLERGRRLGYVNYSLADQILLCQVADEIVPLGNTMWERVADKYNAKRARNAPERDAESLRRKFRNLYKKPKPSGKGEVPARLKVEWGTPKLEHNVLCPIDPT